jgi:hypothetical protein
VVEVDHLGGRVEVGVVVHDGQPVFAGDDGGEEVGDAEGAVPAGAGKRMLGVEGALPVLVVGGDVLVGVVAVGANLLVLMPAAARASSYLY